MYSNKFKYFLFLSCFIALPVIGEIPHFFSLSISKKKAPLSTKKKAKLPIKKSFPKVLKKYSSTNEPFLVEVLAKNLGIVWGMVFINEKELLFTERKGHIKKLHIETGKITNISGAPKVYAKGQGGLLDITLHPYFSKNKKVYISYAKPRGKKQTTAVASGVLKNNKLTQLKDIFIATPYISSRHHFGSRLVFDKKGFLYVTIGDRLERHLAQKLDNHLGKILRLTDKGKAAKGNPFIPIALANSKFKISAADRKEPKSDEKKIPKRYIKKNLPEIWSFGHRNPQGLFIHPETGQLWEQEHGPRGGDEINLIKKGKNYGWPVITYGREYWGPKIGEGTRKKGMEQPVKYYTPSIAPSGLLIYSGKKFKKWKHHFFSGALVLKHLNRIKIIRQSDQGVANSESHLPLQKNLQKQQTMSSQKRVSSKSSIKYTVKEEERLLSDLKFRVRHVIEGPKGFIYISVDKGQILRLTPL